MDEAMSSGRLRTKPTKKRERSYNVARSIVVKPRSDYLIIGSEEFRQSVSKYISEGEKFYCYSFSDIPSINNNEALVGIHGSGHRGICQRQPFQERKDHIRANWTEYYKISCGETFSFGKGRLLNFKDGEQPTASTWRFTLPNSYQGRNTLGHYAIFEEVEHGKEETLFNEEFHKKQDEWYAKEIERISKLKEEREKKEKEEKEKKRKRRKRKRNKNELTWTRKKITKKEKMRKKTTANQRRKEK